MSVRKEKKLVENSGFLLGEDEEGFAQKETTFISFVLTIPMKDAEFRNILSQSIHLS